MNYENHPLANVFPMMDDTQLRKLTSDIAFDGLKEPILLFENKILEGRARYIATQKAKVEPTFTVYEGNDPYTAFLPKKISERSYKAAQRAIIGSRIMTLAQTGTIGGLLPSRQHIAALVGVHHDSLSEAATVMEHGTEEEQLAAEAGKRGISHLAREIRARLKASGVPILRRKIPKPRKTPAQEINYNNQKTHMKMWGEFRSAIESLGHMPRPQDLAIGARRVSVAGSVFAKVPNIVEWLIEVSHEWDKITVKKDEKTNAGSKHGNTTGDDHADAGTGDEAIGSQQPQPPAE